MRIDNIAITDYAQLEELGDYIADERPAFLRTTDGGVFSGVHYGVTSRGACYADIGVCLPADMCVVLEDHGDDRTVGVMQGIRIWLTDEREES
jgi:hypothetical protein